MATGAGLGGLVTALLPLIGLVTIFQAWRKRKRGDPAPLNADIEKRADIARETERRMAAYLAQRHSGGYETVQGQDEQETMR
jgi:hypothetical protein